MSVTTGQKPKSLPELVRLLAQQPSLEEAAGRVQAGERITLDGVWGSGSALVTAWLTASANVPSPGAASKGNTQPVWVVVLPRLAEVDDFAVDLQTFAGLTPLIFPAWETVPRNDLQYDPVAAGRLRILRRLQIGVERQPTVKVQAAPSGPPLAKLLKRSTTATAKKSSASGAEGDASAADRPAPCVIVTSLPALLHPVPSAAELQRRTRKLTVGKSLDLEELLQWLVSSGLTRMPAIELPGEFSLHGGILDIFSPSETEPLRIELFGDEIESIRRFDPVSQKKTEDLREAFLTLLPPTGTPTDTPDTQGSAANGELDAEQLSQSFLDSLPANAGVILVELSDLVEEGKRYLDRLENPRGFFSLSSVLARCDRQRGATLSALGTGLSDARLSMESIERFQSPVQELANELAVVTTRDEQIMIACHNKGEQERLTELLSETDLIASGRITLCQGHLLKGFRLVAQRLSVLSDHELFGRRDVRRVTERKAKLEGRAIDSFLDLNPGDLVVHLSKGIARYHGLKLLQQEDQQEEHLALEFRDGVMVYVPVSLIHMVQKYVGGAQSAPQLSKLGTNSWEKKKQQVAEAVADLAGDMLRLQAARKGGSGYAFPPDSHWQDEFEAAFPYTPTDDQVAAVQALKQDMQAPRPMDRLICGDVGFGKTEVALRAAFKAIDAGKQVAVLVPTTVLAEQHFRSFTERMAEFPFRMEVLSRFRSKGEQKEVLEGLANGSVDLVIGTHRLVQKDIRFHDLGLLIIDEEQRFGVEAKDQLKKLRLEVDVLTLSATPIPRTLHLSLIGVRDISNLMIPPLDRQPVETRICRFDKELIRQGIVRELNRGGQTYFVHNRVYNIESIADEIQAIVPEVRIGIAHGQMGAEALEEVMVQFVNGQLDVLVATTIIESGLDIPNANTMFIHQADKYGLADLHQLRGRVGRYKLRAYCYLMLEEGQSLTGNAAKRLKAIEEFSELGSGFKIAMRDLEIRGAGNILGTEQSGHIASVGYELYCQLLEDASRRLQNLPVRESHHVAVNLPIAAYLPDNFVPPGRVKVEVYRRLSRVDSLTVWEELGAEFRDRFGPLPPPVENLLELKKLQLLAMSWQIDDIHLEDGFVVLRFRNLVKARRLVDRSRGRLRIVDQRTAYLPLTQPIPAAERIVITLKALLQAEAELS